MVRKWGCGKPSAECADRIWESWQRWWKRTVKRKGWNGDGGDEEGGRWTVYSLRIKQTLTFTFSQSPRSFTNYKCTSHHQRAIFHIFSSFFPFQPLYPKYFHLLKLLLPTNIHITFIHGVRSSPLWAENKCPGWSLEPYWRMHPASSSLVAFWKNAPWCLCAASSDPALALPKSTFERSSNKKKFFKISSAQDRYI